MNTTLFNSLLASAIKAPSGHNTQPWRFENIDNGIVIHPDFTRALPVVDADNHELYISLGCAVENVIIAACKIGFESILVYPEKPNDAITIKFHLRIKAPLLEDDLFYYISSRQVNRRKYINTTIYDSDLEQLNKCFDFEGTSIIILNGKNNFASVIPLIIEGNNLQFKNKHFVNELTLWFRYSKSEAEKTKDGLWTATLGLPNMGKLIGNLVMKNLVSARSEANRISQILQHTAGIAIFISDKNDVVSWINTGRAFQRFGLTATKLGICHAHLNMPCEEFSVSEKLAKLLGVENKFPLLLIRYGYAEKMPYSYRRNIEDVILKTN